MNALKLFTSSVGKKFIMAVTGLALFFFVFGHMAGNLQVFLGPEALNRYGAFLHGLGDLLWLVRGGLLAMVALHIWSAIKLTEENRAARPQPYARQELVAASYASRTMIWSGPIVAAFVIFHVLHLTAGKVLELHELGPNMPDVRYNVITGFSNPWISGFYILAMILLCLHLYHGMWSMFQSLGISHPRYTPIVKKAAAVLAIAVAVGNCSIPIAVLTGLLKY